MIQLQFHYLYRQRVERALKEKYPEDEAKSSPNPDALSIDYQSVIKRNKQLKQVKLIAIIFLQLLARAL